MYVVTYLCCPYLFLISPSFGASEGFCFVIVAFPGRIHLYFGLGEKISTTQEILLQTSFGI